MGKLTFLLLVFSVAFLEACASEPQEVEVTRVIEVAVEVTRVVTDVSEVEVTRMVTEIEEVEVTRLVEVPVEVTRVFERIVTATFTPTPLNTPTPSNTPTITPTPTNTPALTSTPTETPTPNIAQTATEQAFAQLTRSRGNGFYLVNTDIAPGLWRSTGTQDNCYWETTNSNGDINNNHFGMSGGTMRIFPSDFQVQFEDCGTWEYLGP